MFRSEVQKCKYVPEVTSYLEIFIYSVSLLFKLFLFRSPPGQRAVAALAPPLPPYLSVIPAIAPPPPLPNSRKSVELAAGLYAGFRMCPFSISVIAETNSVTLRMEQSNVSNILSQKMSLRTSFIGGYVIPRVSLNTPRPYEMSTICPSVLVKRHCPCCCHYLPSMSICQGRCHSQHL